MAGDELAMKLGGVQIGAIFLELLCFYHRYNSQYFKSLK